MTTWHDFVEFARTTAIYPEKFTGSIGEQMYLAGKLASEAGEVVGKVCKRYRAGPHDVVYSHQICEEVGDVLWYVARLLDTYGVSLEDVLEDNMKKLSRRKQAGTLSGSGDTR